MGQEPHRLRLDEILLREGLVSEQQIREALRYQRAHGGKFGSQLLYHGYIDEAGLVKALATQLGCEGVVLSGVEIPPAITGFIPKKVAVARKVIPFDYDPQADLLKIACENPTDQDLINELGFVMRGQKIKLYVAADLVLNALIAKYYLGRDVSLDDALLSEVPDEAAATKETDISDFLSAEPEDSGSRGAVLLVTDEEYCRPLLQSLLKRDNYEVTVTDSADDAIDLLSERQFHTVLIKDTVSGDYIDLIDRLRKSSPGTVVRYYESASALLLREETAVTAGDLLLRSLDLFSSLLSSKAGLPANHSGRVGKYTDKLCRRIGLPDKERLLTVTAAYLHDLATFYYRTGPSQDARETVRLTVKLLQSLSISPVVLEMLRSMYIDLKGRFTRRLPVEVLGGNILTIVDLFCDHIPANERLSLDKFDVIRKKFHDLTGKLFLAEVVEAFVVMVQEEILQAQTSGRNGQVMIYSAAGDWLHLIELQLHNEGFRTVSEQSLDA
ncbi:MAG: HD domain-containing protein, partial [Candidatus Zixiibacteriota bacterium]